MFGSFARIAGVAGVVVALTAPAAAAACPSATASPSADFGAAADATLCLVNEVRASHGVGPLRADAKLSAAALDHARDMVARDYFAHVTPDGVTFVDRIFRRGYVAAGETWKVGENLATGTGTRSVPQATVEAWVASHGHFVNLVDPEFADIGIAVISGSPGYDGREEATYVAEFGRHTQATRSTRTGKPRARRRRAAPRSRRCRAADRCRRSPARRG